MVCRVKANCGLAPYFPTGRAASAVSVLGSLAKHRNRVVHEAACRAFELRGRRDPPASITPAC
eukprot:4793760-Pyramimonas_sp.AAC.1